MTVEPDALPSLVDESFQIHATIDACDDATTDDGLVSDVSDDTLAILDDNDRLWEENETLRRQLQGVFEEIDQLKRQNATLSSQLQEAKQSSQPIGGAALASGQTKAGATNANASSWNERKQQIIEQLENGSFDAEAFLSSLKGGPAKPAIDAVSADTDATPSPAAALDQATATVEQLYGELVQLREAEEIYQDQLRLLREEIETLHLDGINSNRNAPPSTGDKHAEAILADDEIIAQERERLTLLQEEVEEKLRTIEIRSSLERAQFSRRFNELQKLNESLQRQVDDLKQRLNLEVDSGASTRWMQKLGLGARNDP